mmetsp:Transcript_5576/g.16239  ORF Transcript_5576/g.16239 Transcript_5576/m.16239 type:complete len:248 (-) Transcript_5576:836-1579(-)
MASPFSSSIILSTSSKRSSNIFSSLNISKCNCLSSNVSSNSWTARASFRTFISASRSFSASFSPVLELPSSLPSFSSLRSSKNSSQNASVDFKRSSRNFSKPKEFSPSLPSSRQKLRVTSRASLARSPFDSRPSFLHAYSSVSSDVSAPDGTERSIRDPTLLLFFFFSSKAMCGITNDCDDELLLLLLLLSLSFATVRRKLQEFYQHLSRSLNYSLGNLIDFLFRLAWPLFLKVQRLFLKRCRDRKC